MKKANVGMMLIEAVLYALLLNWLIGLTFYLSVQYITVLKRYTNHTSLVADTQAALDALARDIACADSAPERWNIKADFFVCKVGDNDIGWQLRDHKLIRLQGMYIYETDQWSSDRTQSLALTHVHTYTINPQLKNNDIQALHIVIEVGRSVRALCERTIYLNNGLYYE